MYCGRPPHRLATVDPRHRMKPISLSPPKSTLIAVDDPWRGRLRLPVLGTMAFALAFFLYAAPLKETSAVFDHAPWLNDPFDTVISFMMFFVPLMALACMPRILLCRRHEPMPASRIRDILRGCRVVVAGSTITLAVEWISVAIMDNRSAWNELTALQIGLLALMSVADLLLILRLRQTGLPTLITGRTQAVAAHPDWLRDSFLFVWQYDRWFGPLRRPFRTSLDRIAMPLESLVRKHPVWMAAAAGAVFGTGARRHPGTAGGLLGPGNGDRLGAPLTWNVRPARRRRALSRPCPLQPAVARHRAAAD